MYRYIARRLAQAVLVIFGVITLAVTVDSAAFSLANILRGVRYGALAYIFGGVLIALLGRRRLQIDEAGLRKSATGWAAIVAFGVAVVLLVLLGLLWVPAGGSLTMSASMPQPATGMIQIQCDNQGTKPVAVYAPWPQGTPSTVSDTDG